VENQGGAGGNIGMGMVARAPADGYTIMIASSTFMINPSLYGKVPYDPVKDFDPVTIAATTPNVLVVHKSVPANSVTEFVELVRSGRYNSYASGELFKLALKLDLTAVPFHGGGPMIQSVLGGHTPVAFSSLPPAAPLIREGAVRALAVTTAKRVSLLPDVPTLEEAGYPGQEGDTPQCVLVPAGTPRAIVDLLHRDPAHHRPARGEGAVGRDRLRAHRHHAGGVRGAHPGRGPALGEDRPRGQHQDGLIADRAVARPALNVPPRAPASLARRGAGAVRTCAHGCGSRPTGATARGSKGCAGGSQATPSRPPPNSRSAPAACAGSRRCRRLPPRVAPPRSPPPRAE
jgi:hypothetical protein